MNIFFAHYDFNELYGITDMEDAWGCFKEIVSEAISQFVPKTCSRQNPRPRWFNSQIQHQLNKVHTLRRRCATNSTPHLSCRLASAEAKLSEAMTMAKHDYESHLIQDLDAKNCSKIYKYISSLSLARSYQLPDIMYLDKTQVSNI